MEQRKEYKAFISYSHKDKCWAKWLKYRLETFSSKKLSDDKHPLKEIFLDSYNLSIGDLKDKVLPSNLRNSKYLICLCTKHYNSEWVEFEIEEFKRVCSGRGDNWKDYIIPICIGCVEDDLPKCIQGIKAAIIKNIISFNQKEYAVSLIAAKILGINNPDNIYRYLTKILHFKLFLSMLVFLLLLASAIFVWEFNRTKYLYFNDYIEGRYVKGQDTEWIEGVGQLCPSEIDSMRECFRFEYKRISLGKPKAGKWQLRRIVHLNAFGLPTDYEERTTPFVRYPIMDIYYSYRDSTYMPERMECYNEHSILQKIIQISGESLDKLDFKNFKTELSFNEQTLSDFSDPLLEMLGNKYCNITHFDLTRGRDGHVNCIVFKSNNGKKSLPMPDARKHIAMTLARDSVGRIVAAVYWNYYKECDYSVVYKYDGNVFTGKCLYRNQKPIQYVDYKDRGNILEKEVWKIGDSILIRTEYNYQKGKLQKKRKLNVLGKEGPELSFIPDGRAIIEYNVKYDYNRSGLVSCISYSFKQSEYDYSIRYQYNDDNLIIRVEYVVPSNSKNNVVIGPEGFTCCENQYRDGLMTLQKCYIGYDDYYYILYEYDDSRRLTSISYHNSENRMENLGVYSKIVPCDNYEKITIEAINGLIEAKKRGNDMFEGDTIHSLRWKYLFWDKYAKRAFVYDDFGNIEKIEYSNKDSICYVVIDEDILENGDVPLSQSYIINQAGHKFPLCSSFRAIRTKSQYVLNPLEQMIIENKQLDDE